jgi:hypothetical protein
MSATGFLSQLLQLAIALLLAPILVGWVNQCRAWLSNRSAPPLLQPYRMIRKLFNKDAVVAENASWLFRMTPYIVFAAMALAAAIVPSLATDLPFAQAADAIALVGLWLGGSVESRNKLVRRYGDFGFQASARFCASESCSDDISLATVSRFLTAAVRLRVSLAGKRAAARLNHICASTVFCVTPSPRA